MTNEERNERNERRVDLIESITADEWDAILRDRWPYGMGARLREIARLTREIEEQA